ncbi:MAG TPA: hypothetical protein VN426_06205 [Syntrophomonadaceae bacterium]|nr:hypothetical protein [Syntrophomonadaceae bacterium]
MSYPDGVQVTKNKMLRGVFLRTAVLFYPTPISLKHIKTSLLTKGMTMEADVAKVVSYLADKGYIRFTQGCIQGFEDDDIIELTAKGVDLAEGTISDPGVDM